MRHLQDGVRRSKRFPMSDPELKKGLAPVARPDANVLILGSLPGEASLAAAQYYAHPSNQFWRLLGAALGEEFHGLGYAEKLARVIDRRIGLWDMVAEGQRKGSLDQNLVTHRLQDIASLVSALPRLRLVAFNGSKAGLLASRLTGLDHVARLQLPSSSAANTASFDDKLIYWRRIGDYL